MAGLLKEAESIISDTKRNSFVRDAGLILAAQKVEHYEIATYGTLCALAEYLPEKKVRKMLEKILAGEKKTDVALTKTGRTVCQRVRSRRVIHSGTKTDSLPPCELHGRSEFYSDSYRGGHNQQLTEIICAKMLIFATETLISSAYEEITIRLSIFTPCRPHTKNAGTNI